MVAADVVEQTEDRQQIGLPRRRVDRLVDDGGIGGLPGGNDLQAVLLGRDGRVAAGRSIGEPLQQRLTVEQDVDFRRAG